LPRGERGVGGPFIPAEIGPDAPATDPALTRVARDVATAERLKTLLSYVPLRMPLSGDPSVTSPFGYRADPFLGRLALHPGVDLAEAYGAEIHAAASGRVAHAGPAGGYGNMVEIDHGNGLATRTCPMCSSKRARRSTEAPCLAGSARPAARPARICTTKCASTASRSIP